MPVTKIYVLGNPLLKQDSLPLRLMPKLRKAFPGVEFEELDPTENMPEGVIKIIDSVQGIRKVQLITDFEQLYAGKAYSLHDFDLGVTLKLMKKMNKISEIKILGVPMEADEKILPELEKAIKANLLSGND